MRNLPGAGSSRPHWKSTCISIYHRARNNQMTIGHEMNRHHTINIWRIANCCPVCGADRDYSPANPNGIECYCSNDDCGYSEFFSNAFIHNNGTKNDIARYEVLDSNNKVKNSWHYYPTEWEKQSMELRTKKCKQEKEQRERDKDKIYANLADEIHCRKKDHCINIKKCKNCSFCEGYGFDEGDLEFSKCLYPLKIIGIKTPKVNTRSNVSSS